MRGIYYFQNETVRWFPKSRHGKLRTDKVKTCYFLYLFLFCYIGLSSKMENFLKVEMDSMRVYVRSCSLCIEFKS